MGSKKGKEENLVHVDDVTYTLRVLPGQMKALLAKNRVKVCTFQGKPAIKQGDFKKLAHSQDVHEASLKALCFEVGKREADEKSGKSQRFCSEIAIKIETYRSYIQALEDIHAGYHDHLDPLHDETPLVAAYILYSRVISLLKMGCLCLENHFWDARILLRPIDEAVDLADYFVISQNTDQGRTHLGEWFRENQSPPNSTCRQVIAEHTQSTTESKDWFKGIMTDLYRKKSKAIHHTYNGIMEVYKAKTEDGGIVPLGFDYGPCSYPRKLRDSRRLFQFSISTAVKRFYWCFVDQLPLRQEDIDTLSALDQKLCREDEQEYGSNQ